MIDAMLINLLIGFLVVLTIALMVTVIMQLVIRVPFIRTPPHIARVMIGLVPWADVQTVVDLGAGDGSLLARVRSQHPDITLRGCEIIPTVWLLGRIRSFIVRDDITLRFGSLFEEDVKHADVIFLYLFPALMERIAAKLDAEARPGTIVIAQTFGFHGRVPERIVRCPRLGGEVNVSLYRWPARPAAQAQMARTA